MIFYSRLNLTFDLPISTLDKEESSESMAAFFQRNHKKNRAPVMEARQLLSILDLFAAFYEDKSCKMDYFL